MAKHNWAQLCGMPPATPIVFSEEDYWLTVTPNDIKNAIALNPLLCTLANASCRQEHLPPEFHACFGLSRGGIPTRTDTGWVIKIFHYRKNSWARKVLEATDRKLPIPSGGVKLEGFCESQKKERRAETKGTGTEHGPRKAPLQHRDPKPVDLRQALTGHVL